MLSLRRLFRRRPPEVLDIWHRATNAERTAFVRSLHARPYDDGFVIPPGISREGFLLMVALAFAKSKGWNEVRAAGVVFDLDGPDLAPDRFMAHLESWLSSSNGEGG